MFIASNYTLNSKIGTIDTTLETMGGHVNTLWDWYSIATADESDDVIDTWHEISSFLAGVTDTSTLTGLLAGKANTDHNHDTVYSKLNHNHDSAYAALNHNHDSAYAPKNHNHDIVKTTAAGFVPSTANANLVAAPATYSDKYFIYYGSAGSEYKWAKLPQIGAGNLNFKVGTTTAETFHANYAGADKELIFAGGGVTTVSADASTHTITITTPEATAPNDGTFSIKTSSDNKTAQTFKANQDTSPTLKFAGGGATTVTTTTVGNASTTAGVITISTPAAKDGTLTFKVGQSNVQTFSANSDGTKSLNIVGSNGTSVTPDSTNHKITISSTVVNTGIFTIKGGDDKSAQTFGANQDTSPTLKFAGSGGTTVTTTTQGNATTAGLITISSTAVNNGTLTIKGAGTSAQTFGANQSTAASLDFVGSNGIVITPGTGTITIGSPINHDKVLKTANYTYSTSAQDTTILNTITNALP